MQLQYFDGCPNWKLAAQRLRRALALAGRGDVPVRYRKIATPEEADAVGFHGSPTILLDGQDPFADPAAPVGLACRLYRTDAGPDGAPTVEQLLAALAPGESGLANERATTAGAAPAVPAPAHSAAPSTS